MVVRCIVRIVGSASSWNINRLYWSIVNPSVTINETTKLFPTCNIYIYTQVASSQPPQDHKLDFQRLFLSILWLQPLREVGREGPEGL